MKREMSSTHNKERNIKSPDNISKQAPIIKRVFCNIQVGNVNKLWCAAQQTPPPSIAASRGLPELTQNLIRSSHGHSTPSLKISCKSVQPFSRNLADKETKKQRKKETKKSLENNTPSPYRKRGNKCSLSRRCIMLSRAGR